MQPINLFKLPDGTKDPNMRQLTRDGQSFIRTSHGEPQSHYLQELSTFFTMEMLSMLDLIVAEEPRTEEAVKEALSAKLPDQVPKERQSVTTRLVLLAVTELEKPSKNVTPLSKSKPASELWGRMVARTDLLYLATEDLLPLFEECIPLLVSKLGDDKRHVNIVLAPGLKDLVRVHEKAISDYVDDYDDWNEEVVIPEACVLDMIRARGICTSGSVMHRLQQMLMEGVTLKVGSKEVKFSAARTKIKFSGDDLDPMHFRNILNNLVLEVGERSVFVELQLHHEAIYKYNEDCHAHDKYNYFRSALRNKYQKGLDQVRSATLD